MDCTDGATHEEQTFKAIVVADEVFRDSEYVACRFESCTFTNCRFEGCTFLGCTFDHCDLSVAMVRGSRFGEVSFRNGKMIGVDWTKVRHLSSQHAMNVSFSHCLLSYSSFYGLKLPSIEMVSCVAHETEFGEANLKSANLKETDFTGSTFLHTDLRGADFRGALNYAIDPRANSVKGAKFSLPEAVSLLRGLEIEVE